MAQSAPGDDPGGAEMVHFGDRVHRATQAGADRQASSVRRANVAVALRLAGSHSRCADGRWMPTDPADAVARH